MAPLFTGKVSLLTEVYAVSEGKEEKKENSS